MTCKPVQWLAWLLLPEVRELTETIAIQHQTITAHKVSMSAKQQELHAINRDLRALEDENARLRQRLVEAQSRYESLRNHPTTGDES